MFTEDVFIFILGLLVYIAHRSFLDDALYKFTYLLTYLLQVEIDSMMLCHSLYWCTDV